MQKVETTKFQGMAGICICLSGKASLNLDGSVYSIERGSLFIVSPLLPVNDFSSSADFRSVEILDKSNVFFPILQNIIETVLQLKSKQVPYLKLDHEDLRYFIHQSKLINLRKADLAKTKFPEERNLLKKEIQLIEQEAMLETFRLYYRNKQLGVHSVSKNERIAFQFIYSLYQNCSSERSVSHYAQEAGVSTGYFSAIVRESTKKSPSDWIIYLTILNAKQLLENSSQSIKEIAQALHFPEQFTFSKYFSQHVGMSPKAYRNERKNGSL